MKKFEDSYNIKRTEDDVAVTNDKGELVIKSTGYEAFLQCIGKGLTFDAACKYAELLPNYVRELITKGEKELAANNFADSKLANFVMRYYKAQAVFEGQQLESITNAAKNGNWNAAAWLLERRLPDNYSNKQDVKVGSEGLIIKMDIPKA